MDGAGAAAVEAEPVISVRDLHKEYVSGEVTCHALRGVSLDVPRGQFIAIMGASGSGKSTLMNILGCLDRPTSGRYLLAGHDVSALDADARALVRGELLGFVFQGFNLLARTTAFENVEMPLIYRGVPRDDRRARAARSLALVGLGERLKNTVTQLSGGQQQRVAIARALVTAPEVLLADEPTGNLDSRTAEGILATLQWLNRERGLTVVMITHEPDMARCASRIVTLKDGQILSDERVAAPRRAEPPPEAGAPTVGEGAAAVPGPGEDAREGAPALGWHVALRLALRSLARSKLRAALTALGILIGVAAVVTTSALGAGAKGRMEAQMAALGVNLLVVLPAGTVSGGARGAQGTVATLTDEDAAAIAREVAAVAAVAPQLAASVQVVAGDRNAATRVVGTTPDYFAVRDWGAARGALWGEAEARAAAPVCAIGETVRRELFGADDPVGREVRVGRMPCTVVAALAPRGQSGFGQDQDDVVLVPLGTFRAGVHRLPDGQVNAIMVTARGPDLVHRAQDAVTALLRQRHRVAPGDEDDFRVNNLSDLTAAFNAQVAIISALLLVVASVSLLVGGIGVMNIMLVSVTERTREIGIRLAIGARAGDILTQFLVEAVVLAAIGGFAGMLLGLGASALLGRVTDFSVSFQPSAALVAMAVSGGVGVAFGFFPARRAARLDPIVALRHE